MKKQTRILLMVLASSLLFSAGGILGFADPSDQQDWIICGKNDCQNAYYSKSRMVRSPGGITKVWIKMQLIVDDYEYRLLYLEGRKKRGLNAERFGKYLYSLYLYECNCPNRQYRILQTADYDSAADLIDSDSDYSKRWIDAMPDTMADVVIDTVCKSAKSKTKTP